MVAITRHWYKSLLPAAILLSAAAVAAPQKHSTVQDLDYGESLYHYYLGDYPAALSTLMVAQKRGGIKGHWQYPSLMRAGIMLAFGMRERAAKQFTALLKPSTLNQTEPSEKPLPQNAPLAVRDTAHYYLAKMDYLAHDYPATQTNLAALNKGAGLTAARRDDAALLKVNLAIKNGASPSLAQAQPLLGDIAANRALALLNLGNAAARHKNFSRAQHYYRAATSLPAPNNSARRDEYLAIRDKTYTALGYSFLQQHDYASAKAAFRQVRRDTDLANRALLGYGWAAASYRDYKLALKPWQVLRRRSMLDTAVQETLIAIPWAYEQMQAPQAALKAYLQSEQRLTRELQRVKTLQEHLSLAQINAALTQQSSSGALLQAGDGERLQNWLALDDVSVMASSSPYLQQLLEHNDFQAQTQTLKDLLLLRSKMRRWQHKLGIYTQMEQDKRQRRHTQQVALASSHLLEHYRELSAQRDALTQTLNRIDRQHDVAALAEGKTRRQLKRVARAQQALAAIGKRAPVPQDARARLTLYAGILHWRAAQQFSAQRWKIQTELQQLNKALTLSRARSAHIGRILSQDPDIKKQLNRLAALSARTDNALQTLNRQINARAQSLKQRMTQILDKHSARLQDYLAQTRLGIARLYDSAQRGASTTGASGSRLNFHSEPRLTSGQIVSPLSVGFGRRAYMDVCTARPMSRPLWRGRSMASVNVASLTPSSSAFEVTP